MTSYTYLLEDVMVGNFDYAWDPKDIWKLAGTKRVTKMKFKTVLHWIYHPVWSETLYTKEGVEEEVYLSIYQVLKQGKNKHHLERIDKADLSYPIIITDDRYDPTGFSILDGNHRFAKLILQNKTSKVSFVDVVYVSKKELLSIRQEM